MTDLVNNRIVKVFEGKESTAGRTIMPFLTAGYPNLATTGRILSDLENRGVKICEIGIPFSDPIADGPVIQQSYAHALANGLTPAGVFDMVQKYRATGGNLALTAMVSFSIIHRFGIQAFITSAADSGFDGLIIPDLPLEESHRVKTIASDHNLANIMLIAPTTPHARQKQIAEESTGFIYYISVAGVTGQRSALPAETIEAVAHLRDETDLPICVGFGISNAETVKIVCSVADGAIVGSAIINQITDHLDDEPEILAKEIGSFVAKLLE